jgi:[acyl-carrier-protein] S-malonyltransferase
MKKIGFLFPGQGSQAIGMGKDAAESNSCAADLMKKADEVLGYGLSEMCFNGPEENLKQTQNTQPALYAASAATLEVIKAAGITPTTVAGHSLGEYTALYAAGVFDFETGLKLVRTRGLAFAEAGSIRPGAMAAIIGLAVEQVQEICTAASTADEVAVLANINDPTQVVISGDPAAVNRAIEAAKEAKARRALPLPVSGAFHSPLVAPASKIMEEALAPLGLNAPNCLFINNVDAALQNDPAYIKEALVKQVTNSVRWVESIQCMIAQGVEAFLEVGSGKVLAGLCRRIDKNIPCYTTENAASIEKALEALKD